MQGGTIHRDADGFECLEELDATIHLLACHHKTSRLHRGVQIRKEPFRLPGLEGTRVANDQQTAFSKCRQRVTEAQDVERVGVGSIEHVHVKRGHPGHVRTQDMLLDLRDRRVPQKWLFAHNEIDQRRRSRRQRTLEFRERDALLRHVYRPTGVSSTRETIDSAIFWHASSVARSWRELLTARSDV